MGMLLAFILVGLLGQAHAAPQARELDLSSARLEGAVFQKGKIVPANVFDLPQDGVLWAEAESPSERRAPVVIAESAEVSGGEYALIPDGTFSGSTGGAVYFVRVEKAGKFRLSARTFWPDIGSNSFYLQLDDEEKHVWGNDEAPGHIGNWFWLQGPQWQLSEGIHRIVVWWREDGTQLDKIALGPADFVPDGLGQAAAASRLTDRMTVTFPAFKPPRVDRWLRAVVNLAGAPKDAQLTALDAEGKATGLGEAGDMSSIKVGDPKDSPISLRVSLRPDADTALQAARLEYEGLPSVLTRKVGSQVLTFDVTTGALLQIHDPDLETDALVAPSGLPFRLQVWDPETRELQWLADSAVEFVRAGPPGPGTINLKYRVAAPGGRCEVTCAITADEGSLLPSWTIEVENRGAGFDIVEVEYPIIRNVAIGKDGNDDWVTWPNWAGGQLIPNPSHNAPGRGTYCSGRATMHWLDVYERGEDGRGLYLASEDETWLMGALRAEARPGIGGVDIALSKMPRIKPGETWESNTFRCGLHKGDWHAGADLYRAWISQHVKYDPPEWVVESDGWLGRGRGANFLKDIPAHFRRAKSLGLNYVEFWGQMTVGLTAGESCCNRLYFPDPRYGNEADFAEAIRYIRDAGGHIGFYTNGQAWNPRYPQLRPEYEGIMPEGVFIPDWEKEYHNYGLVRPDGKYVPQYAKPSPDDPYPGAFFLMCPATEGWPRYLHHYVVGKYVKQYGVDAMYIDQVGAAGAQWCFADNHLHDEVGAWTRGHMANFRRIKQDGQKIEPDFAIATEGFGDCYGRWVDMYLISPCACLTDPHVYPGLMRYTLPDRVFFDGYANGNRAHRPDREVLDSVFLFGNRFDLFPRSPEAMEYFKRLLYLRQEVGPLLYRGRYMDDVELEVSSPGIKARWWKLDPGQAEGILITVLNPEGVEGATVSVPLDVSATSRAYVADLDHKLSPADCEIEGKRAVIPVPRSPVSTALVVSNVKLTPPALMRVMTPVGAVGVPSEVVLRYRPLALMPSERAMVTIETPPGWSAEPASFLLNEAQDIAMNVTSAADAGKRGHPITVKVKLPDGKALSFPEHLLLHDAFDARLLFDGERVVVTITSNSAARLSGTCTVSGPEWLGLQEREKAFEVGARGTAEIAFAASAAGKITEAGKIIATLRSGNATGSASLELRPPDVSLTNWRHQSYEGSSTKRISNQDKLDAALVIETESQKDRGGWTWRSNAMLPGTRWTFSGEVRTENMRSTAGGARVRIICFHKSKPNAGTRPTIYTDFVTGTTDWQKFERSFEVPKDTGGVQIELFNWHARGRSFWRNLALR